MRRRLPPLFALVCVVLVRVNAEEPALSKKPPVVAGSIQHPIVYDPQARQKALAKAAEERPTDVIFLEEVVVLAPRDNRRIGQAISWQQQMVEGSRFSFEKGGRLFKAGPGEVGLFSYENPMARDAAFSTREGSPRVELFRLRQR